MGLAKLLYHYVYQWQTLLAGAFALLGAWLTVRRIGEQIKQTQAITQEARRREEFAARSALPLALSELTQYAIRCIRLLRLVDVGPVPNNLEVPQVQQDVIGVLQECARYANENIAAKIWVLLSKFQVQRSRLSNLIASQHGSVLTEHEKLFNTLDAADVYAKTAELYAYARDEEGMRNRSDTDALRSALHASGIWGADDHPAMRYLDDRDAEKTIHEMDE